MSSSLPPLPPPLVAVAAAVVQRGISRGAEAHRTTSLVAAGIAGASIALLAAAAGSFRDRQTTFDPFHPERATVLVTDGPNRITRNPMYVGMAGVLVAHAVHRRSVAALIPVAAFALAIDRLQIAPEEAALERIFGEPYDAYRASVPRWLGPV